jgi:hypothetical protein
MHGRINNLETQARQGHRLAVSRGAFVECPCGRRVNRKSRHQRFCSHRCREKARRQEIGRTAIFSSGLGQDTGGVTNPPKKPNPNSTLQTAKARSSPRIYGPREVLAVEVLGGRVWEPKTSTDGVACLVSRLRPSGRLINGRGRS